MSEMQTSMESTQVPDQNSQVLAQEGQVSDQNSQVSPQMDFSKKFEALTRKERMLYEEQARIKQERSSWQEKERKLQQYEQMMELAKSNPLDFMAQHGWDTEKLANYIIDNPSDPYAKKYQSKLDEMESKLKKFEETRVNEQRSKAYQAKINEIRRVTSTEPEKYELINQQGQHDLVFSVMANYYQQYGEILDEQTAADQVEKYLESEVEKMLRYKKIQSKLGKVEQEDNQSNFQQQQFPHQQQDIRPRTLTSSFASVNAPNSNRPLTREESLARAARLIKWND